MKESYNDIINLPHHISSKHPHMDMSDRAAQFSPFAALSGYNAAIQETVRLTKAKMELDEDIKNTLDMKLHIMSERINERPEMTITYFQIDKTKEGGSYETATGFIKKIDNSRYVIVMEDGSQISIDDILEIESELFCSFC